MFISPTPTRYERDDLESLVYTTWFLAGCDSLRSDGFELFQSKRKGEAKTKMMVSEEMLFLLKAEELFVI